jgi:cytochrome P450
MADLLNTVYRSRSLDSREVTALFAQLLTGGVEPTATAAAYGLGLLVNQPEQWRAVHRGEVGYAAAVDEVLRLASPFHFAPRTARRDFEIRGARIAAGQRVVLVLAAANRDPAAFPGPDAFDVRRAAPKHLAFGRGAHFCLGATLARQAVEALARAMHERHPGLRPGPVLIRRRAAFGVTSLAEVPCLV